MLMRHYERIGEFARAEDALFAWWTAEPANVELLDFGAAFYQRLLGLKDDTLAAGNLPRAEVQAGLAELDRAKPGSGRQLVEAGDVVSALRAISLTVDATTNRHGAASLDLVQIWRENVNVRFGGAPVSTWGMRQRRHAEDDALASLIIASNKTANQELALAA